MKNSNILSRCLVSGMILSSFVITTNGTEPLECGIPLDVYEATNNPVPEGIVYEYIVDENGYYILVDEDKNPLPLDEDMTVSHVPWGSVGIEGSTVPTLYDTSVLVENQYILGADGSFDGILNEELQALGVISLEEIFNSGDYMVYLAITSDDTGNIMEELEKLDLFLSVEENYEGELLYSEAPSIDLDGSYLLEENETHGSDDNTQMPEEEPIPEETVSSPSGNASNENWFTRLIDSIFSFFTR